MATKLLEGAAAIGSLLRTSLGPCGRCKMIVTPSGEVIVTRDGFTLMTQIDFRKHPVGNLLMGLAEAQQAVAADGTTTVVVLAGSLCGAAAKLLQQGVHRWGVIDGFGTSLKIALRALEDLAAGASTLSQHTSACQAIAVALDAVPHSDREKYAQICWEAQRLVAAHGGHVVLRHWPCGTHRESSLTLVRGAAIRTNANLNTQEGQGLRIAILSCSLEAVVPKTRMAIKIHQPEQMDELEEVVQSQLDSIAQKLLDIEAEVIICQWNVDGQILDKLRRSSVTVIPWVGGDDLERVAMAISCPIVPKIELISMESVRYASRVQFTQLSDTEWGVEIEGDDTRLCTLLIHAGADEEEAASLAEILKDGLGCAQSMLMDSRIVPGGGCSEIAAALELSKAASRVDGIESLVLQEFANAIGTVASTLAENSGRCGLDVQTELLRRHEAGEPWVGVSSLGEIRNMIEENVLDSYKAKVSALVTATEMATAITKIDDIVQIKPE